MDKSHCLANSNYKIALDRNWNNKNDCFFFSVSFFYFRLYTQVESTCLIQKPVWCVLSPIPICLFLKCLLQTPFYFYFGYCILLFVQCNMRHGSRRRRNQSTTQTNTNIHILNEKKQTPNALSICIWMEWINLLTWIQLVWKAMEEFE